MGLFDKEVGRQVFFFRTCAKDPGGGWLHGYIVSCPCSWHPDKYLVQDTNRGRWWVKEDHIIVCKEYLLDMALGL